MLFRQIADPRLAQYGYLVGCQRTGEAVLIDPERDVDRYLRMADDEGLTITAVTETHIHADFLSGAREFASRGVSVYLSDEGGPDWSYEWAREEGVEATFLRDGDSFRVGNVEIRALHTPGHTPEHLSFLITDHGSGAVEPVGIVTGDFVFVGDLGRPDLLESAARMAGQKEPSARRLYASVIRFLDMPDYLQVWPGHGAGSACGKALGALPQSTIGYERRFNPAIDTARHGEDAFVRAILAGQSEPPLYFARMKRLNKVGAPLLPRIPEPDRLDARALDVAREELTVIDTRTDRRSFMDRHLPGSLYAPLDKSFSTSVGSVLTDPEERILLVVDDDRLDEAVRDLVRIGFDRVAAYVSPAELESYFGAGGPSSSIERISFGEMERRRDLPGVRILDVRYAAEHEARCVPGAIHIPYTRLAERSAELPSDVTLMVHCATGARSAVASALLARDGYDVRYVDGSFAEWTPRSLTQTSRTAMTP